MFFKQTTCGTVILMHVSHHFGIFPSLTIDQSELGSTVVSMTTTTLVSVIEKRVVLNVLLLQSNPILRK